MEALIKFVRSETFNFAQERLVEEKVIDLICCSIHGLTSSPRTKQPNFIIEAELPFQQMQLILHAQPFIGIGQGVFFRDDSAP